MTDRTDQMRDAYARMSKFEQKYKPSENGWPVYGWLDEYYRDRAEYMEAVRDFWKAAREYASQT